MSSEWVAIIVALVTAAGAAFTVMYQSRKRQPKERASTAESITEAARKVVEMQTIQMDKMSEQIAELDNDMNRLRDYVRLFRAGVRKLVMQVEELGITPAWTPDELPPIEDVD